MVELKLRIHKKKFDLDQYICDRFTTPIIFYLGHKMDQRNFYITFVIINFKNKEFTYITSYSPENIRVTEASSKKHLFWCESIYNPHCTIVIDPDEDFYTFIEEGKYFYYINMKKKVMEVITGEDLHCEESKSIVKFGSTFYKDDEDDRFFYFTALIKDGSGDKTKSKVNYYRSDLRLKDIEKIHETDDRYDTPHVTRKYKNILLSSHFYFARFKLLNSGKEFVGRRSLYRHLYRSIHDNFCEMIGREPTDKNFRKDVMMKENPPKFSFFFSLFMKYKYGKMDLKQICDSVPEYSFTTLPGYITLVNLDTDEETMYETTTANPAHFEIDVDTDDVYVSCHNFSHLDRLYFLGSAAIDKFHLHDGKLTKTATFRIPDGYRYTTHKFFRYQGKAYLCTFSQPNRLLLIDAETMSLIHSEDIGLDCLSKTENVLDFINYNKLEPITLKTIEVSDNGEVLLFIGYDGIYFYDFPQKKILTRIPYRDSAVLFGQITLDQFYKRTTHIQFFK